jgi:hypothetical protein
VGIKHKRQTNLAIDLPLRKVQTVIHTPRQVTVIMTSTQLPENLTLGKHLTISDLSIIVVNFHTSEVCTFSNFDPEIKTPSR